MNLIIEQGNTSSKVAVFNEGRVEASFVYKRFGVSVIAPLLERYAFSKGILSTVIDRDEELIAFLRERLPRFVFLDERVALPIRVDYQTPETLGKDRLAAVVGAVTLQPKTDLLVIDAGTCITYDLVDAAGNYLGGNISPGVEMRLEALHCRTALLPRVDADGPTPDLGYDTLTAIRAGVVRGIGYELQGCIRHWQKRYPNLRIFLTGGDRFAFSEAVRQNLLTDSHLVARGLNRLLREV